MHSLYLRIGEEEQGETTCDLVPSKEHTMAERSAGNAYRPSFPAGMRPLHQCFDPVTGLDYKAFEKQFHGISSAIKKWEKWSDTVSDLRAKRTLCITLYGFEIVSLYLLYIENPCTPELNSNP